MLYTRKGGTVCPKGFRALLGREIVIHEICNTKEDDICKMYTRIYNKQNHIPCYRFLLVGLVVNLREKVFVV